MVFKKLFLLFSLTLLLVPACTAPKENIAAYTLFEQDGFTVIKTRADNIKPETIRAPLCSDYVKELGYYGINAGFFNTIYRDEKPPDEDFVSVSVAWSREDAENGLEVCEFGIRDPEKVALGEGPYISRGTLFLHRDGEGQPRAGVTSAESRMDLIEKMTLSADGYIYMIGGGNFYLGEYPGLDGWENWKNEKYQEEGPLVMETTKTGRSGIGIKEEDGVWYAYLAASGTDGEELPKTLEELRALFVALGCAEAIYLDGAGSSQMICARENGELIEKRGDGRYIWSMVRLIDR